MNTEQKLQEISLFINEGKLFDAEFELKKLSEFKPRNQLVWLLLSVIAEKQKNFNKSNDYLCKAEIINKTTQAELRRLKRMWTEREILLSHINDVRLIKQFRPVHREIPWINRFFRNATIERDEIESVLCFSLIWNMFEGFVCNKNASIAVMERAVSRLNQLGKLRLEDFSHSLEYFKNRYTSSGVINRGFAYLNFRQNDRAELVKNVLEGKENELDKVILSLLIIVYRYRNNLFHGVKSVRELHGQAANFRNANQLLMTFLDIYTGRQDN